MNTRYFVLFAALFLLAPFVFADHNININTADKAALETLTGIGPVKAQAIIDYRTENGPYASIEDVQNVSGIGPATYENIRDHITVQGGISAVPSQASSPSPSTGASSLQSSPPPTTVSSGFSVDGGSDRAVIVGADAQFTARAYSGNKAVENAAFTWNFGDGSVAQGAYVTHRFEYAGRYAVFVNGSKDGVSASDHFTITAESAQLSVRVLPDGSVEIENLATWDADLSRWSIKSSGQRFTFPENSLVLAGQTMRISPSTMHFYASDSTELAYPSGTSAFKAEKSEADVAPAPPPVAPSSVQGAFPQEVTRVAPKQVVSKAVRERVVAVDESDVVETRATSSQVAAARSFTADSWMWWLAAAGLSLGAAASVFVARRAGKKEWNIIEEDSGSV